MEADVELLAHRTCLYVTIRPEDDDTLVTKTDFQMYLRPQMPQL